MVRTVLRKIKYGLPSWMVLPLLCIYYNICRISAWIRGCRDINNLPERKDAMYVLAWERIGDMCYVMSFLEAYKKIQTDKKIILVAMKNNVSALQFYDKSYDELVVIDEKNRSLIVHSMIEAYLLQKKYGLNKRSDIVCLYIPPYYYDVLTSLNINMLQLFRKVMFGLSDAIRPVFPKYKELYSEAFENFKKNSRKVIVNPYSYSVLDLEVRFWEELVNLLSVAGYEVYTNVCKEQKVIKGSKELRCSLNDLFSYANECDYFISRRSGIMDLLISCKCKFVAICGNDKWLKSWSLLAWGCNPYVYEQYGEPDVGKIMEYIEQTKDL